MLWLLHAIGVTHVPPQRLKEGSKTVQVRLVNGTKIIEAVQSWIGISIGDKTPHKETALANALSQIGSKNWEVGCAKLATAGGVTPTAGCGVLSAVIPPSAPGFLTGAGGGALNDLMARGKVVFKTGKFGETNHQVFLANAGLTGSAQYLVRSGEALRSALDRTNPEAAYIKLVKDHRARAGCVLPFTRFLVACASASLNVDGSR